MGTVHGQPRYLLDAGVVRWLKVMRDCDGRFYPGVQLGYEAEGRFTLNPTLKISSMYFFPDQV